MTFCLGVRVQDGLVALADTRVTSGTEVITARKVSVYQHQGPGGTHDGSLFLLSAGLRSVRDKMLVYFDEVMAGQSEPFDRVYKAVDAFGQQMRRVASEDKAALAEAGLNFDASCIVGGQLHHDKEPKLYLLYAAGNWVEIGEGTPFHIIGESGYGKPIIRRTLHFSDTMDHALRVGFLAFDSTRISAADVDFPLDVVLYRRNTFQIVQHRLEHRDLAELTVWWQERLRQSVLELPSQWIGDLLRDLPRAEEAQE